MVDFVKWLHDLVRDKGTKWFTKLFFILSILLVLYIIDDYFGWSYYSQTNSKVTLLKEINLCLKDSLATKEEIAFLQQKKVEVINRKNFSTRFLLYIKSLFIQESTTKSFWENIQYEFLHGTKISRPYRFFLLNFGFLSILLISFVKHF